MKFVFIEAVIVVILALDCNKLSYFLIDITRTVKVWLISEFLIEGQSLLWHGELFENLIV